MKALIFLMLLLLNTTGLIMGQTNIATYQKRDINPDTVFSHHPELNLEMNNHYSDNKKTGVFIEKKFDHLFDFKPDHMTRGHLRLKRYPDFVVVEEYPGSSRYYGNMPVIIPDKKGKLLIKKPDNINKYFLIIKDPVHHTIVR
jgi:hypothetical protein